MSRHATKNFCKEIRECWSSPARNTQQWLISLGSETVIVRVVDLGHNRVRLGIIAPKNVAVHRDEVARRIALEQRDLRRSSRSCACIMNEPDAGVNVPGRGTSESRLHLYRRFRNVHCCLDAGRGVESRPDQPLPPGSAAIHSSCYGGCYGSYYGSCCGGYGRGGGYGGCCGGHHCAGYGGYYGGPYYASGYMMPYSSGYAMSPSSSGYTMPSGSGYAGPLAMSPQARESYYMEPSQQRTAMVRVPPADRRRRGLVRRQPHQAARHGSHVRFRADGIDQREIYLYGEGEWMDNGRTVERTRNVELHPGQPVAVDFRQEPRKALRAEIVGRRIDEMTHGAKLRRAREPGGSLAVILFCPSSPKPAAISSSSEPPPVANPPHAASLGPGERLEDSGLHLPPQCDGCCALFFCSPIRNHDHPPAKGVSWTMGIRHTAGCAPGSSWPSPR